MNARTFGAIALAVLIGAAASCSSASSNSAGTSGTTAVDATTPVSEVSTTSTVAGRPVQAGATRMHFEIGPISIKPGQNNIDFTREAIPKPDVDGYIVRIAPDLRLADGTIPGVDVIHLHHGVWLNSSARDSTAKLPERFFAAGEEKTTMALPVGYGYSYKATDKWTLNYMIHNLWPDEQQVWVTYDLDFIPADSAAADGMVAARPIWTDVQNGSIYPVFDVQKGSGQNGLYTYPDDATTPYGTDPAKNASTAMACYWPLPATFTQAASTPTCGCSEQEPPHLPITPKRAPQTRLTCSSLTPTTTNPQAPCRGMFQ